MRFIPVLLAVGMLLIPSCASVERVEQEGVSEEESQPVQAVSETPALEAPALTDDTIREILVGQSLAGYSGNCPCPYNIDSAGNQCGGRSAYSRPGGASPLCYASDVPASMVETYRSAVQQVDFISEEAIPLALLELEELQELAEQGDAAAQDELGRRTIWGYGGVPQDYAEAIRLFRQAAEQGHGEAQRLLGFIYQDDSFVPQDLAEAYRWFQRSAKQGNAFSQYELGRAYGPGGRLPLDLVRSHMWSNLGAAQGEVASRTLRGEIQSQMTPQQIAQAQAMATRCLESNYSDCD